MFTWQVICYMDNVPMADNVPLGVPVDAGNTHKRRRSALSQPGQTPSVPRRSKRMRRDDGCGEGGDDDSRDVGEGGSERVATAASTKSSSLVTHPRDSHGVRFTQEVRFSAKPAVVISYNKSHTADVAPLPIDGANLSSAALLANRVVTTHEEDAAVALALVASTSSTPIASSSGSVISGLDGASQRSDGADSELDGWGGSHGSSLSLRLGVGLSPLHDTSGIGNKHSHHAHDSPIDSSTRIAAPSETGEDAEIVAAITNLSRKLARARSPTPLQRPRHPLATATASTGTGASTNTGTGAGGGGGTRGGLSEGEGEWEPSVERVSGVQVQVPPHLHTHHPYTHPYMYALTPHRGTPSSGGGSGIRDGYGADVDDNMGLEGRFHLFPTDTSAASAGASEAQGTEASSRHGGRMRSSGMESESVDGATGRSRSSSQLQVRTRGGGGRGASVRSSALVCLEEEEEVTATGSGGGLRGVVPTASGVWSRSLSVRSYSMAKSTTGGSVEDNNRMFRGQATPDPSGGTGHVSPHPHLHDEHDSQLGSRPESGGEDEQFSHTRSQSVDSGFLTDAARRWQGRHSVDSECRSPLHFDSESEQFHHDARGSVEGQPAAIRGVASVRTQQHAPLTSRSQQQQVPFSSAHATRTHTTALEVDTAGSTGTGTVTRGRVPVCAPIATRANGGKLRREADVPSELASGGSTTPTTGINPLLLVKDLHTAQLAYSLLQSQREVAVRHRAWVSHALAAAQLDPCGFAAAVGRTCVAMEAARARLAPASTAPAADSHAAAVHSAHSGHAPSATTGNTLLARLSTICRHVPKVEALVLAEGVDGRGDMSSATAGSGGSHERSNSASAFLCAPFLTLPYRQAVVPVPPVYEPAIRVVLTQMSAAPEAASSGTNRADRPLHTRRRDK